MAGPARGLERRWTDQPTDDPLVRRAQQLVANIDRAMADHGLTQQALAEKAGVGAGTLSDIRSGKQWPSIQIVARLEEALGTALWPPYGDA